ncbi:Anion exchange protein 3 [Geodia barretti]|uniref:Anion exchange protein 3 n=1 Tax=Geodia barretti TaxID=519541 RepID=A0AA35SDC1_GEOBA|nr:Anion exchange protein 3 [Geodia barretti]
MSVFKAHNAPGEKPVLLRVYEQRMTNVVVHLLILLTPLAYKGLRLIPIPVALGVFLYLTYSSLSGVQLTKRIQLLFTPPKHHPDLFYIRKVRTIRIHMYTIIQVVLVCLLWGLKLSPAGMIYPVAIVGLIPIRMFLRRFVFSHAEMEALDSEEDFPEDAEEEEDDLRDVHVPY